MAAAVVFDSSVFFAVFCFFVGMPGDRKGGMGRVRVGRD